MAEVPSGGAGMSAGVFLLILVGLYVVWLATGGPHKTYSYSIFAAPTDSGESISPSNASNIESSSANTSSNSPVAANPWNPASWGIYGPGSQSAQIEDTSALHGEVMIEGIQGTYQNALASNQVITLYAPTTNVGAVDLSELSIRSILGGATVSLGQGTGLPFAGQINGVSDIWLLPGQTAYVSVGPSPIGVSFQANACVGFLSQHQEFNPPLESDCPKPPASSIPISPGQDLYACTEYLQGLPSCQTPAYNQLLAQNGQASNACQSYLDTELTYNNCVAGAKNNSNFFQNTWYLYLNRTSALWQTHDTVELLDASGQVIDQNSY